ncbi:Required for respiratory growth protein 9 mitochondrial [Mortierella alpina]|uniref:Required for respiratory growth protein 9, mitochondrial n=1 Tax=Mortierella alpina TaxID=64518 RepID=A0A9P6JED1_MORAP|nr:Required for respiratory growth protein 9 mitochondrial [Mortierella alpina]
MLATTAITSARKTLRSSPNARTDTSTLSDPAATTASSRSDQPAASTPDDSFTDISTRIDAKERWALGATTFAPIVFPSGRPAIAELTKTLAETRIKEGHTGQRVPKNVRNALRDQQSKSVLGSRTGSLLPGASSPNPHLHKAPRDGSTAPMPEWLKHKIAIKNKLNGEKWDPQKKLTRQAMEEVRYLRKQFPDEWTTTKLSEHYNMAGESIRRILRTDFQPPAERVAKQDQVKDQERKENVVNSLQRIKEEKHAAWLERKAKADAERKRANPAGTRIKLGAPKRSIDG